MLSARRARASAPTAAVSRVFTGADGTVISHSPDSASPPWPSPAMAHPRRQHQREQAGVGKRQALDLEPRPLEQSPHLSGRVAPDFLGEHRVRSAQHFERGEVEDRGATRLEDAGHLRRGIGLHLPGQALEHVERRDHVERSGGEWDGADARLRDATAGHGRARTAVRATSDRTRTPARRARASPRFEPVPQPQSRMRPGGRPAAARSRNGRANHRKPRNQKWERSASAVSSSRRSMQAGEPTEHATIRRTCAFGDSPRLRPWSSPRLRSPRFSPIRSPSTSTASDGSIPTMDGGASGWCRGSRTR